MAGGEHYQRGAAMTGAEFDQIVSLMRAEAAERQAWRQQILADFEAALLKTLHPSVLRPASDRSTTFTPLAGGEPRQLRTPLPPRDGGPELEA